MTFFPFTGGAKLPNGGIHDDNDDDEASDGDESYVGNGAAFVGVLGVGRSAPAGLDPRLRDDVSAASDSGIKVQLEEIKG